jgi:hypothetical protein
MIIFYCLLYVSGGHAHGKPLFSNVPLLFAFCCLLSAHFFLLNTGKTTLSLSFSGGQRKPGAPRISGCIKKTKELISKTAGRI